MEKVHPDDVAFKVKTWLQDLESKKRHDAVADFEERMIDMFETARPRYIGEEAVDRVVGRSMSLTRTHRLCWCDR
jgi:hypothetical protein